MRNYNLEKRKFVIAGVAVAIVFGYILRLFTLQIMSDDYKKNADSNAFLNKVQYPARGAIYDRKGRLMVYNQPAYDVTVIMREVENLDTLDFCRTLDITPEFFRKRMEDIKNRSVNPGYSPYTEQVFLSQLPAEEFAVFQEKLFRFPDILRDEEAYINDSLRTVEYDEFGKHALPMTPLRFESAGDPPVILAKPIG